MNDKWSGNSFLLVSSLPWLAQLLFFFRKIQSIHELYSSPTVRLIKPRPILLDPLVYLLDGCEVVRVARFRSME
jgi:hypothetical protein